MKRFYPMDEAVAARADLSMASKGIHAVLSSFARMESGGGVVRASRSGWQAVKAIP